MVSDDRCGCSRFGQLHTLFPVPMPLICRPLACFATLPRYTVNKLTKLSRCDSYTIELLNNRTARLLVLLGIQAQTARIHLAPFGSTLLHLAQLGSTWLRFKKYKIFFKKINFQMIYFQKYILEESKFESCWAYFSENF